MTDDDDDGDHVRTR